MGLDARGVIAVFEVIIYIPILCVGAVLSFRHGFARTAGWVFLVVLSILRIVGGVAHVLSEHNTSNSTERTIYTVTESAGLAPLLNATLGFLRTVSQYSLDSTPLMTRGLTLLGTVSSIGLLLSIFGGVKDGDAKTQSDVNNAQNMRHIGIILFIVVYAGCLFATFFSWSHQSVILRYRRKLLNAIIVTLPFLAIRLLYGILSAFAPLPFSIVNGQEVPSTSNSPLAKFGTTSSSWGIYLVMSVVMEYIAVLIYAIVGIITPLSRDQPDYNKGNTWSPQDTVINQEAYGMQPAYAPSPYAPSYAPAYMPNK